MDPREEEIVAELLRLTWRELAELLRQSGLPRLEGDRKQDLATRLARRAATAGPDGPNAGIEVAQVLLVEGPPEAIEEIGRRLSPVRVRLLSRRAAVVPLAGRAAFLRALPADAAESTALSVTKGRSRRGPGPPDVPPELVAAGYFVRHLSRLLGWPDRALGDLLRLDAVPPGEEGPRVVALLDLWRELLESSFGADEDEPPAHADGPGTPAPMPPDQVQAALEQAIAEQRCAQLVYLTEARGVRTRRVVEPRALQTWQGATYLHAFCRWREAPRVFRLDRIESCRLLDERQ